MGTHTLVFALLAVWPAATPDASTSSPRPVNATHQSSQRSPQALREAVRQALRQQATTTGAEQQTSLHVLAALYQELTANTRLTSREQRQLRAMVRSRLIRASKALQRQLAQGELPPGRPGPGPARQDPPAKRAVLAQVQGNPGRGPGGAGRRPMNPAGAFGPGSQVVGFGQNLNAMTARNARQLIELIETTIAPASWQSSGGPGTIVYFAPKQLLVVRQRDDVHDQIGQAINRLRGN